jgi:hypothetical protein
MCFERRCYLEQGGTYHGRSCRTLSRQSSTVGLREVCFSQDRFARGGYLHTAGEVMYVVATSLGEYSKVILFMDS